MFDNLNTQFHNQILVKFKKFRGLRLGSEMGNDELALAATDCAAALFHFREYLPAAHRQSRKNVSLNCPDYKLIADVTNTVKHYSLDNLPADGPVLLNSSADIYELGIIINFEGKGEAYSHSEPIVCVNCTDGRRRCLDEAIVNVVNYWGLELHKLGEREFKPIKQLPYPGTTLIAREEARSLRLGATQGLKFSTTWQFMKFDYDAGFARPVDLSGADATLRMLRPKQTLDLAFNIPNVAVEYVHEIDLSDEQSQDYLKLSTDAEREAFHLHLAAANKKEIDEGLGEFLRLNAIEKND